LNDDNTLKASQTNPSYTDDFSKDFRKEIT